MRNLSKNTSKTERLDLRDINEAENRRANKKLSIKNIDNNDPKEDSEGLYIISVAAKILAMHPQTLRKYERAGLISPSRTIGMLRLYSMQDINKIRLIRYLVDDIGMNLSGVGFILNTFEELEKIKIYIENVFEASKDSKFESHLKEIHTMINKPFNNIKHKTGTYYE
tara:strand:+ start:136 stop:639 length:504 start_codon:yes stop_codon:yes gene_type:complete